MSQYTFSVFLPKTIATCPKHPENVVTLFCSDKNCLESLCVNCIHDHSLLHDKRGSKPTFGLFSDILSECEAKLKTIIRGLEDYLSNLKKSQDIQGARSLEDIELEKIKRSKEYLINFIEKFYSDLTDNFHGNTRPLESRLEKILSEAKSLEEMLKGKDGVQALNTFSRRDFGREIEEAKQNFTTKRISEDGGVTYRNNITVNVDYARLYTNIKAELQRYISLSNPLSNQRRENDLNPMIPSTDLLRRDSMTPPAQSNEASNAFSEFSFVKKDTISIESKKPTPQPLIKDEKRSPLFLPSKTPSPKKIHEQIKMEPESGNSDTSSKLNVSQVLHFSGIDDSKSIRSNDGKITPSSLVKNPLLEDSERLPHKKLFHDTPFNPKAISYTQKEEEKLNSSFSFKSNGAEPGSTAKKLTPYQAKRSLVKENSRSTFTEETQAKLDSLRAEFLSRRISDTPTSVDNNNLLNSSNGFTHRLFNSAYRSSLDNTKSLLDKSRIETPRRLSLLTEALSKHTSTLGDISNTPTQLRPSFSQNSYCIEEEGLKTPDCGDKTLSTIQSQIDPEEHLNPYFFTLDEVNIVKLFSLTSRAEIQAPILIY